MRAQHLEPLVSDSNCSDYNLIRAISEQIINSPLQKSEQKSVLNLSRERDSAIGIMINENNLSIENLIFPQQKQNIKFKNPMIDPDTVTPLTASQEMNVQDIPDIEERKASVQVLKKNMAEISKNIKRKIPRKHRNIILQADSKMNEKDIVKQNIKENNSNKKELIELSNKKTPQKSEIQKQETMKSQPDLNKQISFHQLFYIDNLKKYILDSSANKFMAQMYTNHFIQTCDILQQKVYFSPPENFQVLLKIQPQQKQQKTLVIDLDETLIHCNESKMLFSDFYITVQLDDGQNVNADISIRPYASQFLQNMSKHYEIMIYTASNEDYANQIIDYLDPKNEFVKYRIFRDDCIKLSNSSHIKDLRILGRDLEQLILIDNSAYSFLYQINNGIPIIPYLDNKNDDELQQLEIFLMDLLQVKNVMLANEKIFKLEKIRQCNSKSQAIRLFF